MSSCCTLRRRVWRCAEQRAGRPVAPLVIRQDALRRLGGKAPAPGHERDRSWERLENDVPQRGPAGLGQVEEQQRPVARRGPAHAGGGARLPGGCDCDDGQEAQLHIGCFTSRCPFRRGEGAVHLCASRCAAVWVDAAASICLLHGAHRGEPTLRPISTDDSYINSYYR